MDGIYTGNEEAPYNKVTLAFQGKDEFLFQEKYFSESIVQFRLAYALVIVLYCSFGYLDYLMFPESSKLFYIIRYAIVVPIFSVVFLLSFTKVFSKIWQLLILICFIVGGSGIGVMTMLIPENYTYYAGMMLVFFAGYFFVKLRFFYASIAGWSTLLIFNILSIYYAQISTIELITSNFFYISANLIGMFAAYNIENHARRNFSLNQILDIEKLAVVELNKNLEQTIKDRTKELVDAKELVEESELQFRYLFEGAADAIFIADEESGLILDINQAAERLMQLSKNKIIGIHQSKLHPSNSEEYATDTFQEHLKLDDKSRFTTSLENKVVRNDGTLVPVEILAAKTIYKGKNCLVGTFRNITERKKAELELLQAKEAAEVFNANVSAIIEGTTHSIWAFNRNYEILYINRVFQQEFKQSFGVLLEPGINLLDSLPKSIVPVWKPRYDRVLNGEQYTLEDGVNTENEMLYIQIAFNPILKNGKVFGGSCFGSNITARKIAEIELIKAKEKAEESDRLKSAFLANMSHEIRTPMNGILGFAELLKEPNLNGEEQQDYIDIIEQSGVRMLNIINDIVDISKIEAGLMEVDTSETNVNKLLEYIYTFFKPEADSKGLNLSISNQIQSQQVTITTDKEKLYAILINLVKNAIKYTNRGSIKFGFKKKEGFLEFFVEDTGIGISEERHEAIFERFIQADISDKFALQGAGLGLSISKAYVNMLGGKIGVESEKERGSIFYFTLPYNNNKTLSIIPENTNTKIVENASIQGLNIVIAEDDKTSASLITLMIRALSGEIHVVGTGNEAIEICRKNPGIDIVLMDIQMPDLNGYEATRQIREFNKEVVIIAQTAFGLSGDKEKAIEAGCNDYISKPINQAELLAIIKKHTRK